jgi:hypothetical protein
VAERTDQYGSNKVAIRRKYQSTVCDAQGDKVEPSLLTVAQLDADIVLRFLDSLEQKRGNAVVSRNLRLTAIRSFYRMAALYCPESVGTATRILAIP